MTAYKDAYCQAQERWPQGRTSDWHRYAREIAKERVDGDDYDVALEEAKRIDPCHPDAWKDSASHGSGVLT